MAGHVVDIEYLKISCVISAVTERHQFFLQFFNFHGLSLHMLDLLFQRAGWVHGLQGWRQAPIDVDGSAGYIGALL